MSRYRRVRVSGLDDHITVVIQIEGKHKANNELDAFVLWLQKKSGPMPKGIPEKALAPYFHHLIYCADKTMVQAGFEPGQGMVTRALMLRFHFPGGLSGPCPSQK